jgi:hypothetical protein
MNYEWQERKKFAIPVAAGVFVLLIWYLFILSGINRSADRDLAARKSSEENLRRRMVAGVPTDETVARAERDRTTLQNDLKEIQSRLAFQIDPGYRVKEGQTVVGRFGGKRQELFTKLDSKRARLGIEQPLSPNLGFPAVFQQIPEPELAEWMLKLAVLDRVCNLAYDCQVGVKLADVETLGEPTVAGDKFLGALKIRLEATGAGNSILKFVHGLQTAGPAYLALETCDIKAKDPAKDLLGATMSVSALVVNQDGVLVAEKP